MRKKMVGANLKTHVKKVKKGILIDVVNCQVREVDMPGDLNGFYQLLGCNNIDYCILPSGDAMYVDGEALLKDQTAGCFQLKFPDGNHTFQTAGRPNIAHIENSAFVFGTTANGNKANKPKLSVEQVKQLVYF